jgi:hypothetical protein
VNNIRNWAVVQRFTLLNWLCALFVSDNIENYFTLTEPRLKFFNISYQSGLCSAAKLDSCKNRSELLRKFWNVVLQKDSVDHLDWSFKEWRCIRKTRGEHERPTHNKTKEAKLDNAATNDTKSSKWQNFFLDIYVTISTEYFCMFQSTMENCQGITSKQCHITPFLCAVDIV